MAVGRLAVPARGRGTVPRHAAPSNALRLAGPRPHHALPDSAPFAQQNPNFELNRTTRSVISGTGQPAGWALAQVATAVFSAARAVPLPAFALVVRRPAQSRM